MEPRPLLESHFGAWPTTFVAPDDFVPLLETPGGGGCAPTNWLREIFGATQHRSMRYVAWAVLALGVVLTAGAWRYVQVNEVRRMHAQFERDANSVLRRVESRLSYYESSLTGVAAFASIESADAAGLTRDDWDGFVGTVGADKKFPGMLSVSFAAFNSATKSLPITQTFPGIGANRNAIGFNIASRPEVREALERARDTGTATISPRVGLVFANNAPGFLMYVPTFREATAPQTVESRRAAFIGYVVAVFDAQKFTAGAVGQLPPGISFAIYDGDTADSDHLLYGEASQSAAHMMQKLRVGGREWTFAVAGAEGGGIGLENEVLFVGVVVTLILFGMTGALTHSLDHRKQVNALLAKRARYREAYAELGRFALVSGDIDATIEKAIAAVVKQTGAEYVSLLEHLPHEKELLRRAGAGWQSDHEGARIAVEENSPAYHSLTTGETVLVRDALTDARFKFPPVFTEEGICCAVTALVLDGENAWGVLIANAKQPNSLGSDEAAFVQTIANIIAEALRRRRANEVLHQAQKMEAVGQLTGGIAHDFNNLLTVVMGNMELLLDDPSTPVAHRSGMEMTMQAARRGADLTQKMLAFSRRQPLHPQTVELDRTISEMEGLLKRALGEHIEIETHLPRDLWRTHVDRTQLETAILNLAVNARDAMPNGGRLIIEAENVELDDTFASTNEVPRVGPYVCLTIADTGTGMEPEVLKRVFEPFFTTKEVGKGSGLGLSMVYGFVRQSGGYVKLYSEVGHGTTARIYLPRAEGDCETARVGETKKLVRGNESVLVVEDDALVRELAVGMIRKLGYEVVVATNGKEALAVLDSDSRVDLMFSDVVMPGGISGTELASEALTRRPGIKVLLTSGYSEHTVTKPGEKALSLPLISKPYRASDLAARIRAILDDGKPARDAA